MSFLSRSLISLVALTLQNCSGADETGYHSVKTSASESHNFSSLASTERSISSDLTIDLLPAGTVIKLIKPVLISNGHSRLGVMEANTRLCVDSPKICKQFGPQGYPVAYGERTVCLIFGNDTEALPVGHSFIVDAIKIETDVDTLLATINGADGRTIVCRSASILGYSDYTYKYFPRIFSIAEFASAIKENAAVELN